MYSSLRLGKQYFSLRHFPTLLRCYSTIIKECPACSSPLPSRLPTCTNCNYIEPIPDDTTYFDLLEIPSTQDRFKLDVKDLRRRFLKSQRVCHPDAWSSKGQKAHNIAEAQSSLLNTAYKTLLSPVLRAQYILTLEGFPPSEVDKFSDPEFIMEVMEMREELEEVQSEEALEQISSRNDRAVQNNYEEIARLIAEREWESARTVIMKAKYLEGIEDAIKDRRHTLSSSA